MCRDSFWVAQPKQKKIKMIFFLTSFKWSHSLRANSFSIFFQNFYQFFFSNSIILQNFFSKIEKKISILLLSKFVFSNFFIQFFLCFVYKISLKNFLFHQRIYGINFKRIDNGLNFKTISTTAAREIFKKSENWCLFLWSFITYFNERKK